MPRYLQREPDSTLMVVTVCKKVSKKNSINGLARLPTSLSVAWRIESPTQRGSGFESGRGFNVLSLSKKRILKFLGHTSLFSKSVPRLLWVLT